MKLISKTLYIKMNTISFICEVETSIYQHENSTIVYVLLIRSKNVIYALYV